jgi:hypothetical protein
MRRTAHAACVIEEDMKVSLASIMLENVIEADLLGDLP